MPEHLSTLSPAALALDPDEQAREHAGLRALDRSPHPYHHQSADLPHPSDHFVPQASPTGLATFSKEPTPASDSGTDADDEHFLKGLPAPKARPHKGLRGRNDILSGTSTPLLSSALLEEDSGPAFSRKVIQHANKLEYKGCLQDIARRRKVLMRRATEAGLVVALGFIVRANKQTSPVIDVWRKDFRLLGLLFTALSVFYPVRIIASAYWNRQPSIRIPLRIPVNFDPAPLLYPPIITVFVSLLISVNNPATVIPNIILSISSIPQQLVPKLDLYAPYDILHWFFSCLPMIWHSSRFDSHLLDYHPSDPSRYNLTYSPLTAECAVLLYPLHRTLCIVLHHLTTTSLLTAELQLLSIALINVLILASSPQAQILKALLWGGGLSVLILCSTVIRWGISLARVPKWRFRREFSPQRRPLWKVVVKSLSWQRIKSEILGSPLSYDSDETAYSTEEEDDAPVYKSPSNLHTLGPTLDISPSANSPASPSAAEYGSKLIGISRRHTLPNTDRSPRKISTHTPSGRKKRTTSASVRAFFKLTQWQATVRKWVYAAYVYLCLTAIVIAVIRVYIEKYALRGNEPVGWALGYFFGDLPWFRFQVVNASLERWICLPARFETQDVKECHLGWAQHMRHDEFGEANTRLIICGYWVVILIVGLAIVFQLKDAFEVDTRRKVFHFMMVGMLLPTTYIDPTFVALALSVVLTIFLVLDLLRASQLPPLSKPIASFLTPYVDGRDFRGPVVISHIFLLIGCAIPLWLSLASLPRTGSGYLTGWELPTRDVSMVSGVICVGLGDAAASLIGRRYGHRKWLWGGGKSLEGSVAFVAIVFLGLVTAKIWLRVGNWPVIGEHTSAITSAGHSLVCASMASLTETVLTGGNDNVIVPVVLWTCVKALGL